jgi:RimJ/RimL family protein N-acetyltransferase
MPTAIRCFAVLDGGNSGKILTDDLDRPRCGYVWETDDGVLYRGGAQDASVLYQVVTILTGEGNVALGFRDGDPSVDLFPPNPDAGAACLEFDRPIRSSDLSPYLDRLPVGYEIHRMDRTLLERCPGHDENIIRYGSIDNFLNKGLAICITRGDEIVCEAYADMDVMGVRELGVDTQETYRGQGLATIACAHLIEICEDSGSRTYWDCAKLNLASAAVARKLGFQNERAYKLLAWFRQHE